MSESFRLTPRNVIDRMLLGSHQLVEFLTLFREMLVLGADVARISNTSSKDHSSYGDLGVWADVARESNRLAMPIFIQSIDAGGYANGLATVRLMTYLETAVDDLVIALLQKDDRWRTIPIVTKPTITGTELDDVLGRKRVVSRIMKASGAKPLPGIARSERVLAAVGCGGSVDEDLSRAILELAESRHVLVHRDGVADSQLRERCPWVPIWAQGKIRVTYRDFGMFATAVMAYGAVLMVRLQENGWFDGDPMDWKRNRDELLPKLAEKMRMPRPEPTGTIADMVTSLDEFNRVTEQARVKDWKPGT